MSKVTRPERAGRKVVAGPLGVLLVTLLLVVVGAPGSAASPKDPGACGVIAYDGARAKVFITAGHPSCRQARSVGLSYVRDEGEFHGPVAGPRSQQYVTLPGGWRCGVVEQGSVGCSRGGTSIGLVLL
jgi:hypothetical protein